MVVDKALIKINYRLGWEFLKAYDFEADGIKLSDKGFIICYFGSKGLDTVSNGSQITFNRVSALGGARHRLTSTEYEDCLETTIQICKNSCSGNDMEISASDFRELTRWLNRKKFVKLKILDEDHTIVRFASSWATRKEDIEKLSDLL